MVEPLPPGHLLVLRPRRPDPTPPARAFPPSRARRSRGRPSISPLVGAVSLIAAALLLVAQSAAATQASYQIATLKPEQARLSAAQPHPYIDGARAGRLPGPVRPAGVLASLAPFGHGSTGGRLPRRHDHAARRARQHPRPQRRAAGDEHPRLFDLCVARLAVRGRAY